MTASLPHEATVWHTVPIDKAIELLNSDRTQGLTSEEVAERQREFGLNELEETGGRTAFIILLDQFKNVMLIMLIAVAIISGIMDLMDLRAGTVASNDIPFKDTIAILAIVFLNGLLGYMQESRAEKALAALKNLSSPKVRVNRNGKILEIDSKELVPGDIMMLEAGVQIAADGRLLDVANLQVREAALTGEAQAVNKRLNTDLDEDTPLGDRRNTVFQGTEVVNGRGTVLVTNTGMKTEIGKIATMLQSVESEPTPLQQRMDHLSKALVTGALSLVAIVIVGGVIVSGWERLRELVEVSLSMAVAVVPEGLPAVITVTLAIGTQRMVRRHALIRKLPAVETLGSVTTICSDKTGTLTQNKMVVQAIHPPSGSVQLTGQGYVPEGDFLRDGEPITVSNHREIEALMAGCLLCNDAVLQKEEGEWAILGDPTEGALVVAAAKTHIDRHLLTAELERVQEFSFSSERKRMSVIVDTAASKKDEAIAILPTRDHLTPYLLFCKGSPELVLERCDRVLIGERPQPLTDEQRQQIVEQNNQLASKGLRVLGFSYKSLEILPDANEEDQAEQGMVWLGLVDMLDAPRPEVRDAVARCRSAGIRPIMITGDHQLTARAIAEDLGIAEAGDTVITGRELEHMENAELDESVRRVCIYARVAPEHKLRIVQSLQRQGKIVAMTGDGVNDAPALKQADIGIAMGITGTDVSKEASDTVLLDDNFATIVAAVEEGRVVYTNVRRFIKYILGSNIGEVLTIAVSPLLVSGGVPLTPLQILWMNLVTDGLPALALAVEPAEPNVMARPPHDPKESIFARGLGAYMVRIGIVLAIIATSLMVFAYWYTNQPDTVGSPGRWRTMVFTTLCVAQMGHALAIRSNTQLTLELNPLSNPYVIAAVTLTTLLQLALIYVEPLRNFFGTEVLNSTELLICIGFSSLMFVWVELEKIFLRFYFRNKRS
ncbi:cation-translocating P-type ATPase [Vacuolonema iberomarrocanum]|uniref:cation-translocating P-type ATPase n=1 Tax=Vacuolonema iberomarrocanum TaxID=3454632 RepID=UPI003F6DD36B